jgi:hypothetical protein
MKWEHFRQSDNVEVDCLGLRANLTGPAGQAALSCQHEVVQLRGSVANAQDIAGIISGSEDEYQRQDEKAPDSLWTTFLSQLYNGKDSMDKDGMDKDGMDKDGLVTDPKRYRHRLDALKAELGK